MPAVCLNMIVKNEGAVIERCLRAVLPFIDCYCIVDTGSTDDTLEKIRTVLEGVTGELHERPWVDFAHNRTEAIDLAKDWKGLPENAYLLFVDADDVWTPEPGFEWPELDLEAYYVKLRLGNLGYLRPVLVQHELPWRYQNAVHEAVTCGRTHTKDTITGVQIQCRQDGARRSQTVSADKYAQDAARLEEQLEAEPWNRRAMFYLAQSYRDAGDVLKAAEWYQKRVDAEGWAEERWQASLELARLLVVMQAPWESTQAAFLRCHGLRPTRAEPLVALSSLLRGRREFAQAHVYACAALDLHYPEGDILFVDEPTYEWRALDEYAVTAFYVGKLKQGAEANASLLRLAPESEHQRIRTNLAFCTANEHKGAPLDQEAADLARTSRERFQDLHQLYTTSVSTEAMAASLEACALLYALCVAEGAESVLDLGSGLSSAVLRTGAPWRVDSVDHDPDWLDRTREFLCEQDLHGNDTWDPDGSLTWTLEDFLCVPPTPHDVAFMDLGHTPGRADHLQVVWDRLRVGGLMVVDDIHHVLYRARVQEWLGTVAHEQIDVHAETMDSFGRYAWLVRKTG